MRHPRFRAAALAAALLVLSAAGVQVVGERPAAAQTAPYVIVPTGLVSINADEKVALSKIFNIQPILPIIQTTVLVVNTDGGVRVDGEKGKQFATLEALLAASITATADGGIGITIQALTQGPLGIAPVNSVGGIGLKFVPAPTTTSTTTTSTTTTKATTPAAPVTNPPVVATSATVPAIPSPTQTQPPPVASNPVGAGNRAPTAQSTQLIATASATTPLTLQASDPDGNPLTYVLVQLPSHGKLSGRAPALSYTPDGGFLGTDALVFTASDGKDTSGQATVTVTVTGATGRAVALSTARAKAKAKTKSKSRRR